MLRPFSFTVPSSIISTVLLCPPEPPVQLARPAQMKSIMEPVSGEPLFLECEVSRDNAEVRWLKDGVELELDNENVTVTTDGLIRRLTIHSPSIADSGKYTCDARDDTIDFTVNVKGAIFSIFNAK